MQWVLLGQSSGCSCQELGGVPGNELLQLRAFFVLRQSNMSSLFVPSALDSSLDDLFRDASQLHSAAEAYADASVAVLFYKV